MCVIIKVFDWPQIVIVWWWKKLHSHPIALGPIFLSTIKTLIKISFTTFKKLGTLSIWIFFRGIIKVHPIGIVPSWENVRQISITPWLSDIFQARLNIQGEKINCSLLETETLATKIQFSKNSTHYITILKK